MTGHSGHLWLTTGLLALVSLLPSTAHASCGHYVHTQEEMLAQLLQTAQRHHSRIEGQAALSEQFKPAKPCNGPLCTRSDQPSSPMPSVPVVTRDGDHWGQLAFHVFALNVRADRLPLAEVLARPNHVAISIFHPPR